MLKLPSTCYWRVLHDHSHVVCIGNPFCKEGGQKTNCFVFESEGKVLIVDPGTAQDGMDTLLKEVVGALQADYKQVSFFMTHLHIDHADFGTTYAKGKQIYVPFREYAFLEFIQSKESCDLLKQRLFEEGMPKHIRDDVSSFQTDVMSDYSREDIDLVYLGDVLEVGALRFEVLDTQGHTPGCVSLFERESGILISGDFLLFHALSPLSFSPYDGNVLKKQLDSIERLNSCNIVQVFPAHGRYGMDWSTCVSREKSMRSQRVSFVSNKILQTKNKGICGYETMSKTVRSSYLNLQDVSYRAKRWGSVMNSLAYLNYLVKENRVSRDVECGIALYRHESFA